jgi:hypothetical protein
MEPCVIEAGHWHEVPSYCRAHPTDGTVIVEVRTRFYEGDIKAGTAAIPPSWRGNVRFSVCDDATAGQRYLMRILIRYGMFRKAARWRINT